MRNHELDREFSHGGIPLTPESACRLAQRISAFALEFYEDQTGEPKPLHWIEDRTLVKRFVEASGLWHADRRNLKATLKQKAYVRIGAKPYFFFLYKVDPDLPGFLTLAGGHAVAAPELHAVILEAYRLGKYNPREEARRIKAVR